MGEVARVTVGPDFASVLRGVLTSGRQTAVYRVYATNSDLLYVGCSSQLVHRFFQHRRTSHWWPHAAVVVLRFVPRADAFIEEAKAIHYRRPLWNVRDNLHYFDADLVAAREAYGPMPERFVHPRKHHRIRRDAALAQATA